MKPTWPLFLIAGFLMGIYLAVSLRDQASVESCTPLLEAAHWQHQVSCDKMIEAAHKAGLSEAERSRE